LAAAIVLTLALTTIFAGGSWLLVGSRLKLAGDPRQNELLNILVYAAVVLPFAFTLVFFAIERF
jgi:hypothetical protein